MSPRTGAACLEIVRFRLAPGADEDAFRAASPLVGAWTERQPGFLERALVESEDGWFTDLIWWRDEAAAKTAFAAFGPAMGRTAFARAIDPASVNAAHCALVDRSG